MSTPRIKLIKSLDQSFPEELLEGLVDKYIEIKQQFYLGKFQPTELNAARFCEYVLRLLEFIDKGQYTPLAKSLNTSKIIGELPKNISLTNTVRQFIPNLVRVLLDVRNQRDVAHVGGEVSPNFSDSLFVVHSTDWIFTELIRHFYVCPIEEARRIVISLNETKLPVIGEFDGFLRVLDPNLAVKDKTLLLLYHKQPTSLSDANLLKWSEYSNSSRYKKVILKDLHQEVLVHYQGTMVTLTAVGIKYVESKFSNFLMGVNT